MAPDTLEAAASLESTEVETVAREIAASCRRSIEQRTPLFLLVFYGHEKQKLALLASLRQLLREAGLGNQTLDPRHRPEHAAGKLYGAIAAGGDGCIALLFDLPLSPDGIGYDPAFLAYLNLNRDRIARQKLRIVLLLPSSEAELFTRVAGDLWDFRQHTWWLNAPVTIRGEVLWRELDERSAKMLLAALDKGKIDEQIRRVRALVARTQEPAERAATLLDLSCWLAERNAAPLAVEVALEGLAQGADLPLARKSFLELQVGYSLRLSDRNAEAMPHLEQSLVAFRELGDRANEALALSNISLVYKTWGQYDAALHILEAVLTSVRDLRDRSAEAIALNNISQIYDAQGNFDGALAALEQGLAISREMGNQFHEAIVLNNIAAHYLKRGRQKDAIAMAEKSLAYWRENRDIAREAQALNTISLALDESGRHSEALKSLERSLALYREIGHQRGEAVTSWNLGRGFEQRGDLDRAIALFRQAVAIEQEIGHPDWEKDHAYLESLEKQPRAA